MSNVGLEARTLVDAVADRLRSGIFAGDYSPGDTFVEVRLAEELGVHRPVIRSAVMMLVHEGLLRKESGKSAYIPELTSDDIEDLFGVRLLVECEAVRRVATRRVSLIDVEHQLQMMEAVDDNAWEEILRLDFQFHCATVDAAGSPRLSRIYRTISTESRLALTYLHTERLSPSKIAAEHRELYDGICAGDPFLAVETCRAHIEESAAFINQQIQLNITE